MPVEVLFLLKRESNNFCFLKLVCININSQFGLTILLLTVGIILGKGIEINLKLYYNKLVETSFRDG